MSFEDESRWDKTINRCRLTSLDEHEEEEGISPVLSPGIPRSPHQDHHPATSVILNSPWSYPLEGGTSEQHHVVTSSSVQVLGSLGVVPSTPHTIATANHIGVNGIEELHEESDLQQPWYTCLYSPPSLQQSPLQELVEGVGNNGVDGHPHHRHMAHPAVYSLPPSGTPTSSLYSIDAPSHTLPLTLKVEENRHEDVMAALSLENQNGIDCVGMRVEDYRMGSIRTEEEEGCVDMMTATGTWMVEEDPTGGTWPPIKIESWNNPHSCRYVSEEGAYWLPSGWQMANAGMMDGSMGSPEESVASPQDGASTSGNKRPDSKKCGVCGDRALGYNFNAITCESCKAFFRRNALKNKEFRCPFQDSCKVDQVTRRFCQKCRLRKCFEIGMKKEWIMTDEEKQRKKQKIEENRARKMGDAYSDDDSVKSSVPPFSPFSAGTTPEANKPQAIVVGVIRSDDESSAKVLRAEGQTDIHSQERTIIQSTGAAVDRVSLPSNPAMEYSKEEIEYTSDYTSSPPESQEEIVPRCSEEQEFSRGIPSHPSSLLPLLPYSHATSPNDNSDDAETPLISSPHTSIAVNESPGSAHCHTPLSPATPSSQTFENLSMSQVMALHIKKEVEYTDGEATQSLEEPRDNTEQPQGDCWQNFSVQEAMRVLQPGCKPNINVTGTNMMDSIMNTAISAEYSAFSLLGSCNPRELNEPEKMKLNELSEANKGLMAPLCEDYNFKDLNNPSLINIINMTEIAIRRLIKMSKRISAFKSLCQEDQIALLKGGCTEMMILRSVFAYDPDKDSWTIQQDHDRFKNIKLKVLKAAPGNVYEEHKRFILAFQPEWRRDLNIIFLLSAITLFMPERPNIIHTEAIKHEQCSYLYLLKRYLECKYGGCEGRTVYHRLLERINHLHILNENHIRVFLEVNPQEVEPLLIEIFDLKQR